jgi:hypothetical protein
MPNPVVHFEIGCRGKARTGAFYTNTFGWTSAPYGPFSEKLMTGAREGIEGHITSLGHEPHNYVIIYIQVEDLASALARVSAEGGRTVVPAVEIPDGDAFAWIADPEGNLVGLLQRRSAGSGPA